MFKVSAVKEELKLSNLESKCNCGGTMLINPSLDEVLCSEFYCYERMASMVVNLLHHFKDELSLTDVDLKETITFDNIVQYCKKEGVPVTNPFFWLKDIDFCEEYNLDIEGLRDLTSSEFVFSLLLLFSKNEVDFFRYEISELIDDSILIFNNFISEDEEDEEPEYEIEGIEEINDIEEISDIEEINDIED